MSLVIADGVSFVLLYTTLTSRVMNYRKQVEGSQLLSGQQYQSGYFYSI